MAVKCKQKFSVVIVFIVLLAYPVQLQDECQYKYTIQPPDQLDCNPYGQGFSLSCRVEGPRSARFSVEWYRYSSIQTTPEKLQAATEASGSTVDGTFIRQRITLSGGSRELQDTPVLWCQVVVEGRLQVPSHKLMLQPPSFYTSYETCSLSSTQSVGDESCADLDPSPTPSLSPSPTASVGDDGKPQSGGVGDNDNLLETALFSIIGVIAVFCIVIVTLVVTIVILKKVRRVRIKGKGAVALNPLRETVELKENVSYGPVRVQSQTATQEPVYDVADTVQPREDVRTTGNVAYGHFGPNNSAESIEQ